MPNSMKVLMVTPRYFPYMGGIETHVYEVGRRLSQNGVNMTVLTTVAHEHMQSLPQEDSIEGMRILRVPAWPKQRDYYLAPAIRSVIKGGSWDLVHCQGCHTLVPPLAMLAAKEAQLPYVLTFHTGGHSVSWRNNVRAMQWHVLRPLLGGARRLIGVSQFEANYFRDLLHIPARNFSVIPNGAVMSVQPASEADEAASSLIISIGRLEKYKGHHRLIAAMPAILERCPTARLLVLGSGPYEAALRQLAQETAVTERVEIRAIPAGDRQAMATQLARASLVALLSEYEAHPIAVMEALSLQRPVLVADTSGLRELAQKGLARAIPLQSTAQEIAEAVLQQMTTPFSLPADFRLPTWESCTQQLQEIYAAIVARREAVCAS